MNIKEFIRKQGGRITFHDFMEHALYCPEDGYYGAGKVRIGGIKSDFLTHPELCSPTFATGLLEEIYQRWLILGHPRKLDLYEMGVGTGRLIDDFLTQSKKRYPELYQALQIHAIEVSPNLIKKAKQRVGSQKVEWIRKNAIDYPWPDNLQGIFIANELVDSFPVHRVKFKNNILQELYVLLDNNLNITEILGDLSNQDILKYFDRLGFLPNAEQHVVVNLAAIRWLKNLGKKLKRGFLITIDYGGHAEHLIGEDKSFIRTDRRLYHGTYPYKEIGRTDITSDVDFSSLILAGREVGLEKERFEPEYEFFKRNLNRHRFSLDKIDRHFDYFLTGRYQVLIQSKEMSTLDK